jgi:putative DNA primase/helicase
MQRLNVRDVALGKWPGLLLGFGLTEHQLSGKHCPCPVCGGHDRFRFDDKDRRGKWICSKCGAGDGFDLLRMVKGWSFKEAAKEIEHIAGRIKPSAPKRQQSDADKLEACKRIWQKSRPVTQGDPVSLYLHRRTGIKAVPPCIRFHPALTYRHDDGTVTRHPAMLARIQADDGSTVAIHRTYLTADGQKADVPAVKKTLCSFPPPSAVRLSEPGSTLGIAEGIETALCASMRFGVPVWAAISAVGLEHRKPPADTKLVVICGDNDVSYTGQAAAFALAKRLTNNGIDVEIKIPDKAGEDWADTTR